MARFTQCPQHLSRWLRPGRQHGDSLSPFQTRMDPKAMASTLHLFYGVLCKAMKRIGWCSSDFFSRYLRKQVQIPTALVQANPDLHRRVPCKQTTPSCSPLRSLIFPDYKGRWTLLGLSQKKHRSSQASESHIPPSLGSAVLCLFWMYTLLPMP